jgi:hypothetical protein
MFTVDLQEACDGPAPSHFAPLVRSAGRATSIHSSQGRSRFMNTPDRSIPDTDALSIAELEARFEMQGFHLPRPPDDGMCHCTIEA